MAKISITSVRWKESNLACLSNWKFGRVVGTSTPNHQKGITKASDCVYLNLKNIKKSIKLVINRFCWSVLYMGKSDSKFKCAGTKIQQRHAFYRERLERRKS